MYNKSKNLYKKNSLEVELSVADPHKVIQLMMQGFIEKLAQAKGAIERQDYESKSIYISSATAILNGLIDSLDFNAEKVITDQLLNLYTYMRDRLIDASVQLDITIIDEVISLMLILKEGWDKISDDEKQKAYLLREKSGIL